MSPNQTVAKTVTVNFVGSVPLVVVPVIGRRRRWQRCHRLAAHRALDLIDWHVIDVSTLVSTEVTHPPGRHLHHPRPKTREVSRHPGAAQWSRLTSHHEPPILPGPSVALVCRAQRRAVERCHPPPSAKLCISELVRARPPIRSTGPPQIGQLTAHSSSQMRSPAPARSSLPRNPHSSHTYRIAIRLPPPNV
jgi:hypothetical protein